MKLYKLQKLLKKELETTQNTKKREFLGGILEQVNNHLILRGFQAKREKNIFKH
jgi:hypothetical protein